MTFTPDAEAAIEAKLAQLDLETKVKILSGQDFWSLPPVPEIGLDSIVVSDGPIGVRGTSWTAADPSIAMPSPTALAATWDVDLARQVGRVLGQESRRKGVHVLLAPTVNLHRSPLGGRHFEAYSEDPLLTGAVGTAYVQASRSTASASRSSTMSPTTPRLSASPSTTRWISVRSGSCIWPRSRRS